MYKVCFQEARAEHWQFAQIQRSEHQDKGEKPGES